MPVTAIKDLFEHGQYQAILDRLAQQDIQAQIATLNESDQVELHYYQSRALLALGHAEKGIQVASTAHTTLQAKDTKSPLLLASMSAQIRAFHFLGQVNDVERLLTEGNVLLQGLTVEDQATAAEWIPVFELSRGIFLIEKNQNLALDFLSQALTSFEKLTSPSHLAETLWAMGLIYYYKGDYDTALGYYQRSRTIYEKLEHNAGIASVFLNVGFIYFRKGEWDAMAGYYHRSLPFAEASGSPMWIVAGLRYIGYSHGIKSEFNTALGYFQRALTLAESIGDKMGIMDTTHLMSVVYYSKGELDQAFEYLQRSLILATALKEDNQLRLVLPRLIKLSLTRQDLVQAQTYLTALQDLATRSTSEDIHFRSRLMEAMVSKVSSRMVDKARAQTLLKQLVTEEHFRKRWNVAMEGLLHLCDLLIFESRASGEGDAWEEAKTFLDQFHSRAQEKGASEYLGEALLLKAKFALIDGELQQAQTYLDEAKTVATNLGMRLLVSRVEAEQTQLATDFEKWQDMIRRNAPLQERLAEARLEKYLQKAQDTLTRLS